MVQPRRNDGSDVSQIERKGSGTGRAARRRSAAVSSARRPSTGTGRPSLRQRQERILRGVIPAGSVSRGDALDFCAVLDELSQDGTSRYDTARSDGIQAEEAEQSRRRGRQAFLELARAMVRRDALRGWAGARCLARLLTREGLISAAEEAELLEAVKEDCPLFRRTEREE